MISESFPVVCQDSVWMQRQQYISVKLDHGKLFQMLCLLLPALHMGVVWYLFQGYVIEVHIRVMDVWSH